MILDMVFSLRWAGLVGSEGCIRWDGLTGGNTYSPFKCFSNRCISHCEISLDDEFLVGEGGGRGNWEMIEEDGRGRMGGSGYTGDRGSLIESNSRAPSMRRRMTVEIPAIIICGKNPMQSTVR